MAKKILKIIGIIAAAVLVAAVLFFIWTYVRIRRGDLVKWNNHWYTKEQLKAKYPPQVIDVPAKNTPEEVYAKFRQALLDDDIETALELIRKEKREEYREVFANPVILDKYKQLPEADKIKQSKYETYGNFSSYYYSEKVDNEEKIFSIEFEKNEYGYWKIDFI